MKTKKKVENRHMYYNKSSKKLIGNNALGLDKQLFLTDKKSNTLTLKTGA